MGPVPNRHTPFAPAPTDRLRESFASGREVRPRGGSSRLECWCCASSARDICPTARPALETQRPRHTERGTELLSWLQVLDADDAIFLGKQKFVARDRHRFASGQGWLGTA